MTNLSNLSNLDATATFATLSDDQLAQTTGGFGVGTVVKAGARIIGKRVPVLGWAYSGYCGVNGYRDARAQGKGVGSSLLNGAKKFAF